jgi:ATP phosphoribosyltransferase
MRIALAKGRLSEQSVELFKKVGFGSTIQPKSRKLVFKENGIEFILLKPKDVVTYVASGVADLGIVGSDVILEHDAIVYELFDLGFSKCKFSVASINGSKNFYEKKDIKVATKYPSVATEYFKGKGKDIEVIELNGSVELAPIVGLSDCIVDIVETGKTLKANNLEVVDDILDVSARLICNTISYQFMQSDLIELVNNLKEVV